ncbi:helix-turn-helix domain-containing protein [Seonamhaeicola sp.]|uniref:helix-turn-helix domain-containing protein n=1 Tax=Seonamhaeicola sp. TaxID=1912245 RepID=UPI00260D6BAE|nr:helix-turn-helix domain-containing protein [Seonamhaeicola sp.]
MMSISVLSLYLFVFDIKIGLPQLLFIDDTFMLAYGPLLFLFTQSVLFKHYKLKRTDAIHFIPFFIAVCLVITTILFVDTRSLSQTINDFYTQQIPPNFRIVEILILTHIFYYLYRSKQYIQRVLHKVKGNYSSFNQAGFKLLKFILNSFIVLFLLSLMHSMLPFIGIKKGLIITLPALVVFMFYFINSILLRMLNHVSNESGEITRAFFKEKEKYAGSRLSQTELDAFKKELGDYMKEKRRFLDSELSINDLSVELGIPLKVLSQVINEGYGYNFFDFVNKYRIDVAKSLLMGQSDDKLTVQEVMYDSGFNSKSSFNTAFKKFTNLTPTQFKKGSTS